MRSLIARYTPAQVVRAGRILALITANVMTVGYVTGWMTTESAAILAYLLGSLILIGVPDQRASELLGAQAIWMTVAEFLSAAQAGHLNLWRWAVSVSALAVVLIPIKIQYMRSLARAHPYRALRDLDRRVPPARSAVVSGTAVLQRSRRRDPAMPVETWSESSGSTGDGSSASSSHGTADK